MKTNNSKKIVFSILLLITVFIAVGLIYSYNKYPYSDKKIKIGVILPLTGPVASLGESAKNGVLLAKESLEKTKNSPDVIFEDDHFDPKTTILAYNKLKDINKVSSVICFASSPCNAIAPLAEKDHIILIAIASDPSVQVDKKYVFRLEISPLAESRKISEYIKYKEYKSISSIIAIQSGVQSAYKELIKDSKINDLVMSKESVVVGESDYRTILVRLLDAKPQAIIVGLLPGDAGVFIKQARDLGFKGDFLGFNFVEGEETLKSGGISIDGLVYSQADDSSSWFTNLYQKKYSTSPDSGSSHVYDAFNILFQSQNDNNTEGALKYIEELHNYNGALGVFSSSGSHEFVLPVILKTVRDGWFVKL